MAKTRKELEEKANKRAELIIMVRSGQITAAEAARRLGVSRKTYYEWENRALHAMMMSLQDRIPGRPSKEVDQEKAALEDQ